MPRFFRWIFAVVSLRKLVALGFALGVLPLVIALYYTFSAFRELDDLCRGTVYQVVEQVRKSRALLETLVELERKSRQYLVLETPAARSSYEAVRSAFHLSLAELQASSTDPELSGQVSGLGTTESVLFDNLMAPHLKKAEKNRVAEDFRGLYGQARTVASGYSELVGRQVDAMNRRSDAMRQALLQRAAGLLAASMLIVVLVTFVVHGAIRQLDAAIRQLGRGGLEKAVHVSGPRDIEYLGERLEWLRKRLLALGEERQRFFRNISHELKTPLTTIHEGVELLADQVVGELNREQAEIAHMMSTSSQRLHKLIEDLTHFGQLNVDSFDRASPKEYIDVEKIVASVIDDYQIRLRANSIALKARTSPVRIRASPVEIRTVVDNLLSNAVKYSPIGAEIRVFLGQRNRTMCLEVEDDGPGIPAAERDRVFEPFFQGESTRATGVRGSGLGLAIVRECVVAYRGSVTAVEPRYGKKGARLRVTIPTDSADEATPAF